MVIKQSYIYTCLCGSDFPTRCSSSTTHDWIKNMFPFHTAHFHTHTSLPSPCFHNIQLSAHPPPLPPPPYAPPPPFLSSTLARCTRFFKCTSKSCTTVPGIVVYTLPGQSLHLILGKNMTLAPSGAGKPGEGFSTPRRIWSVAREMR